MIFLRLATGTGEGGGTPRWPTQGLQLPPTPNLTNKYYVHSHSIIPYPINLVTILTYHS